MTPACRAIRLDLDLPIADIPMEGFRWLHVTAFSGRRALGIEVFPAPLDPFPGWLLATHLRRRFADSLMRLQLEARLPPGDPPKRPTGSVVLCTRDRPALLARAIASLHPVVGDVSEIIVVDNADRADDRAKRLTEESGFRYVHEPVPGLSRARNRGAAVARGEVILYTDDDIQVHPEWAARLLDCFADPLVMAACGMVLAERLDTAARMSFERWAGFHRGTKRVVFEGSFISPFRAAAVGAGASMGMRATFLRHIAGFPEEFGTGTPTGSGEDHYVLYRVLAAGFRAVHEPAAVSYHLHRDDEAALQKVIKSYSTGAFGYLAKAALEDRDPAALTDGVRRIGRYFAQRSLRSALRYENAIPPYLARAEMSGIRAAPRAYCKSRRLVGRADRILQPQPMPTLSVRLDRLTPHARLMVSPALPSMSVVIPTRGRRDRVLRLLRLLESQHYPEGKLEFVAALDGDIDGTAAAIREATWCRRTQAVVLEAPLGSPDQGNGAGPARNHGAGSAVGDILVFLDDDVTPLGTDVLLAHASAHACARSLVVAPCPPDLWDVSGMFAQQVRTWAMDQTSRLLSSEALGFSDVATGNVSITRAAFRELEGFMAMPRREDWEFGYRAQLAGLTIRAAPDAAVIHDADIRVPNAIRDRYREGMGDVIIARRHPQAFGWLPLGWWYEMRPRTRRMVAKALHRPSRYSWLIRAGGWVLPALERAGLREEYVKALSALNILSYWAGVATEAGSIEGFHEIRTNARRRGPSPPVLDLSPARWTPPTAITAGEVDVAYRGITLGRAQMRWGRLPWSGAVFLRAVADRFADDVARVDARKTIGLE